MPEQTPEVLYEGFVGRFEQELDLLLTSGPSGRGRVAFRAKLLGEMKIAGFKLDLKMQISNLNLSIFGFIYSELKYNENNQISYFLKCLKKGFFQGFSSGLFAALLALNENPKSEIIISGIGLEEGGGHFYTSKDHAGFFSQNDLLNKVNKVNKFRNTNRKKVEAYLFKYLKDDIKKRMLSTDKDFCKLGNIKYFDCSIIT